MQCLSCGGRISQTGKTLLKMYGKLAPSTVNCCFRGVVLFIVGGFLTLVLNILTILPEIQEDTVLLTQEKILNFFSGAWWVPICCGFGAVLVGLMYPCMDSKLGSPHNFKREWSSVARCVAIFVGINHASVVSFHTTYDI